MRIIFRDEIKGDYIPIEIQKVSDNTVSFWINSDVKIKDSEKPDFSVSLNKLMAALRMLKKHGGR